MTLISFLSNEKLTLATGKLVYEPDEIDSVSNVIEQANKLSYLYSQESEKIESATREGYDSGYEKGQAEGYEAALEHIAVKLVILAKEANAAREALEERAGDLAIKIVEKIASDLGTNETIAALAKSAAAEMLPREPVVLRVHPDKHQYMTKNVLDHADEPSSRIIDVISDPALAVNDCVLETEFGQITADLKTQLKVLRERMYGS